MKPVGILGGMGPEATILLMQRLLRVVPARDDADHIPLIVHQNPAVPSRIARLIDGQGEDPGPVLAAMARDLEAAGAKALAMPCNTAHAFVPQIIAASSLPFLDMRTATVAMLPPGRVGMLASPAVRLTGVFDEAMKSAGTEPVWPQDDGPVLALIRRIKAGDTGPGAMAEMARLAEQMADQSDHLLIACTELSLLTGSVAAPFTDSLDCLVSAIVRFSQG
ncbi:aspartate/glutamate racemase family protein [Pseudotabrizicola alkalilacus]|uniref:Amino acid racemase n=1 Tax=Pseudotabrizicola alkalilacus TaxID=2305252 RepID=A0A411Z391_9RHOB|nr:amino acid racemase [Pseudotabrizicola alkalilacus]RGP37541.1 amino acid racemase [Pseudotabrizicola alkalilacus]